MKAKALALMTMALLLTGCGSSSTELKPNYDSNQLVDSPLKEIKNGETSPWNKVVTKQYWEELEDGRYRYCTALVGYTVARYDNPSVESTSLHCSEVFEADGSLVSAK